MVEESLNKEKVESLLSELESEQVERTFIRPGPRRGTASEMEERRLTEKRTANVSTFHIRPAMESSVEQVNIRLFKKEYLPNAGLLLFGLNVKYHFFGAYIQYVRFFAKAIGITKKGVEYHFYKLQKKGKLKHKGSPRAGRWIIDDNYKQ